MKINIFFLDRDPTVAARYHIDKHVIKMILESCQLLSTAHRVLDGKAEHTFTGFEGKRRQVTRWVHPNSDRDVVLYQATHLKHPCCLWVRESASNYNWLWELTLELNSEFRRRYDKDADHMSIQKLKNVLRFVPRNLRDRGLIEPPQCMPVEFQADDFVQGYRNYYVGAKSHIAVWTRTPTPEWFLNFKMK